MDFKKYRVKIDDIYLGTVYGIRDTGETALSGRVTIRGELGEIVGIFHPDCITEEVW